MAVQSNKKHFRFNNVSSFVYVIKHVLCIEFYMSDVLPFYSFILFVKIYLENRHTCGIHKFLINVGVLCAEFHRLFSCICKDNNKKEFALTQYIFSLLHSHFVLCQVILNRQIAFLLVWNLSLELLLAHV